MSEKSFLAVDLGAESGRVIAGLFDGRQIRLEELHRFPNGPVSVGDTLRWDVLRLWSEIQTGLGKAAAKFGNAIVSVGVDTWGVDYVLLTKSGEMLGQPYCYRDARTSGQLDATFRRVSRSEIFAETGLQFMEINSLFQLLSFQQTNPALLAQADKFLMMPDLFHWLLCGSQVVEFTNATTSQCLHPTSRTWAYDLLRKLELPTQMFPQVVDPGTKLGRLRESVAQRTNLPRLDVVTPATHDTGAAVAAIPTEYTGRANWAYISSGTWSLMGLELPHAVLTPRALELNVTNEGGIDGTYRLLKNIMGLWLVQECRRSFERAGQPLDERVAGLVPADVATSAGECRGTHPRLPGKPGAQIPDGAGLAGGTVWRTGGGDPHRRRRNAKHRAEPVHSERHRPARRHRAGRSDRAGERANPGPDVGRSRHARRDPQRRAGLLADAALRTAEPGRVGRRVWAVCGTAPAAAVSLIPWLCRETRGSRLRTRSDCGDVPIQSSMRGRSRIPPLVARDDPSVQWRMGQFTAQSRLGSHHVTNRECGP
jgi:hypothetical protein